MKTKLESGHQRQWMVWLGLGLSTTVLVGIVVLRSLGAAPQIGTEEAVTNSVDALFTAVTSHNPQRLEQCAATLKSHREAGRLPATAADYLDGIIEQARNDKWDTAARRLYRFVLAQRGES